MSISIDEQIAEIVRILDMRKKDYTSRVNRGKMKPEIARQRYDLLRAIYKTLTEVKKKASE